MNAKVKRVPNLRVVESVRLDLNNQCLWRGNRRIALRPKDYAVLRCLAEHAEQLVTKAALLEAVWPGIVVTETVLKACINRLRHALSDDAKVPHYIETVHRLGYRLITPIATAPRQGLVSSVQSLESQEENQKAKGKNQKAKISDTRSLVLDPQSRPSPAPSPQHPTPFLVGREAELAQLHNLLDRALNGERQVVFVTGEPGIGKTTLVEAFRRRLESQEENQKSKIKRQKAKIGTGNWGLGAGPSSPQALSLKPQASPVSFAHGQCINQYGTGEAYLPILEAFERLCRLTGADGPTADGAINVMRQHAPVWLAQLPVLSDPGERLALQRQTAGATRERMMRECAHALEVLTAEQGLVLWMDDLHWSDGSTLSLLDFLARRREPARLLVVGTYRPSEVVGREHPLAGLTRELRLHDLCQELPVTLLTEDAVAEYLTRRFDDGIEAVSHELARLVYQRTEGNPLFMVNVVTDLLATGVMAQRHGRWELQRQRETGKAPASLRQFIEQQIEWLSGPEQEILAAASVAGMEFSAATVATSLDTAIAEVEQHCAALARRELFFHLSGSEEWADGTVASRYRFVHTLHQEVLYARVTAARRVQLHRRIGLRKEQGYVGRAGDIALELAVHFEHGRDHGRAVQYLEAAARTAMRRRAPREAITHLTHALELLKLLPDIPDRAQQELSLLIALGVPLLMTKGYADPEVEQTYTRARELCQRLGALPQLFPALHGLWVFHEVRADLRTARVLAEEMLAIAQREQTPALLLQAHHVLGETLYLQGELLAAREHLERAIALYDPQQHDALGLLYGLDPGVVSLAYAAWTVGLLGYAEQKLVRVQQALTLARQAAFPLSSGVALIAATIVSQSRRDARAVQEQAEAAIALSTEQGLPLLLARAAILRGWALTIQGRGEDGIAQIHQGLSAVRAMGAIAGLPYFLALLVEAYEATGQMAEGLQVLDEALLLANRNNDCNCEAELYRLRGELLLAQEIKSQRSKVKGQKSENPNPKSQSPEPKVTILQSAFPNPQSEAEACFFKAIAIAQQQQAKSFELRATISLVRLRQQQAKDHAIRTTPYDSHAALDETHHMLSEIYHWFTEGFDTPDLQEAKALLQELGRSLGGKSQAGPNQV